MARAVRFELIADSRRFTAGFDKAQKKASGFERAMGGMQQRLAGVFAGGAVLAGLKKVTDAGSDLNETANKVGLAFGRNAGEIQSWAKGSAKAMGLPKQAALENASTFGLLFSKLGIAGDESARMSKQMVQLAVDLGSVHNADPSDILEAQQAAFRGEYDALQRFVPALSDAAVKQEALKETGKKSTAALTDQEKAAAVYTLMLKQTKAEQGDFARTSDQAANKAKINAARMADLSANIGTLLLPALTAGTNKLGDMADWVERNRAAAIVLGGAIAVVTGLLVANAAATKLKVAWDTAWAVGTKAVAAGQWLLNAALSANPIGLVIVAVAALAGGLIYAYKHSETFRRIVDGAFRTVAAAGRWMWDSVLRPTFSFLLRTWLTVASGIVEGAATAFGWVPGIGPKLKQAAEKFRGFRDAINHYLDGVDDERVNVTARAGITWTAEAAKFRLAAGRMATGGKVPGGWGGGDRVPILAEPGEAVVDKHRTRKYASVLAAMGVPGFTTGGLIPGASTSVGELAGDSLERMTVGLAKGLGRAVGSGLTKAIGQAAASAAGGMAVPSSGNRSIVHQVFAAMFGWGSPAQLAATDQLIMHESGYRNTAQNPTSTAYGLFQFLNGTWAGVGGHKTSDPRLQAIYGGRYIRSRYGSPAGAWSFWQDHHWYDQGGWLQPGLTMAYNGTGRPERVIGPREQVIDYRRLAAAMVDAIGGRLVVSVDDVHAGLKGKKRRNGYIPLGLD